MRRPGPGISEVQVALSLNTAGGLELGSSAGGGSQGRSIVQSRFPCTESPVNRHTHVTDNITFLYLPLPEISMLNTCLNIQQWPNIFQESWPREYRCSRTDKWYSNHLVLPKSIPESSTRSIQHGLIRLIKMQNKREMDLCFEKLIQFLFLIMSILLENDRSRGICVNAMFHWWRRLVIINNDWPSVNSPKLIDWCWILIFGYQLINYWCLLTKESSKKEHLIIIF